MRPTRRPPGRRRRNLAATAAAVEPPRWRANPREREHGARATGARPAAHRLIDDDPARDEAPGGRAGGTLRESANDATVAPQGGRSQQWRARAPVARRGAKARAPAAHPEGARSAEEKSAPLSAATGLSENHAARALERLAAPRGARAGHCSGRSSTPAAAVALLATSGHRPSAASAAPSPSRAPRAGPSTWHFVAGGMGEGGEGRGGRGARHRAKDGVCALRARASSGHPHARAVASKKGARHH